jgi:hypothetical protein
MSVIPFKRKGTMVARRRLSTEAIEQLQDDGVIPDQLERMKTLVNPGVNFEDVRVLVDRLFHWSLPTDHAPTAEELDEMRLDMLRAALLVNTYLPKDFQSEDSAERAAMAILAR